MGSHKPMISKPEFDGLQVILGRKGRPHITKHDFAYKSVLKCGGCEGSVTAEEKWQIICSVCKTKFHRGKRTTSCPNCSTLIENIKNPKILHYVYYHCARKINKDCTELSIPLKDIEREIDSELKRFEISEKFKDWAIEYLNELNDCEVEDREVARSNMKLAYDDCVKKLDNLLKLKISPRNGDGSVISEEEYTSQRKYLLQEKEDLLAKVNDTDRRIDTWHELSEKTFNFACYARHWFAKGDLETKTQILGALGSNLVIKDKKLWFDGQKAFFLIEKGKEEVLELAKKLEPAKRMEIMANSLHLEQLRSTWLRDLDLNQDTILQRDVSYR